MLYGAILPGEQRFNEERWANDILNKCYFDDRLWGYMICIVEELQTRNPAIFMDGVLYNLITMGKVSTDESVQIFSRYRVLFSTFSTEVF